MFLQIRLKIARHCGTFEHFSKKKHFLYLLICSIHAALMLAYFGAGGVTEQELSKVLGKKRAFKK